MVCSGTFSLDSSSDESQEIHGNGNGSISDDRVSKAMFGGYFRLVYDSSWAYTFQMRMLFITLPILVAVTLFAVWTPASVPAVSFSYAAEFDGACAQQTKYQIDPAWISELKSRLPELTSDWAKEGSALLGTSETIIGKPFRDKQVSVSLSVCSLPSMADPMLINMRFSLKAFTPMPLPEDVTVGIIFHELLHRYLVGKIPADSPILMKYRDEDDTVKSHLHLLALQESVYLKLGRSDTLHRIVAKDRDLPNKSYGRAWDIVDSRENRQDILSELRR
jgi:hypothetical protein